MKTYYYIFIQLLLFYNKFKLSDGQGFISVPEAVYTLRDYTSKIGVVPFKDICEEISKTPEVSPEENIKEFTTAYNKLIENNKHKNNNGFKSLKDLVNLYKDTNIANECGRTDIRNKIRSRVVPQNGIMCWQNNELRSGFLKSHHGPCEVWIDDTLVLSSDDCVAQFGWNYPSCFPIEYDKCPHKKRCILKFFWADVYSKANGIQLYSSCAPIRVKDDVKQIKPELISLQ